MARRSLENRNIRKLTKAGGKSISVTIPIEIIRELKWKEKQRVVVTKKGNTLMIKDYVPHKK